MTNQLKKFLTASFAFLSLTCLTAGMAALPRTAYAAEGAKEADVALSTITDNSGSTVGGLVFSPFDSVAVYPLAASGSVELTFPVSAAQGSAVVFEFKSLGNSSIKFTLSALSEGEEYLAEEAVENGFSYAYDGKAVTQANIEAGSVFSTPCTNHVGFGGHIIVPLSSLSVPAEKEIDHIKLTATAYRKFCVGAFYVLDAAPAAGEPLDLEGKQKAYAPAADTFEAGGDTDTYRAQFMPANGYYIEQNANSDANWNGFLFDIPESEIGDGGLADVSEYKYLAIEFDFSDRSKPVEFAAFFMKNRQLMNANRYFPSTVYGIGNDGRSFFTETGSGAKWHVPAGFKGTCYVLLDNFTVNTNYDGKIGYVLLYTAPNSNTNGEALHGKLTRIYFTDATIETSKETVSVTTSVNDAARGRVLLDSSASVVKGSSVKVIPDPFKGFVTDNILVDGVPVETEEDGTYTIPAVEADTSVTVNFKYDPNGPTQSWELVHDEHSAVVASFPEGKAPKGSSVTFTASADSGYKIASMTVNGDPVELDANNSYTVPEILEDLTVAVTSAQASGFQTALGRTDGIAAEKIGEAGTVYADFDGVYMSSKLQSAAESPQYGSSLQVGIRLDGVEQTNVAHGADDVLVIRYQNVVWYGNKNGAKFLLQDSSENRDFFANGSKIFLYTDGELAADTDDVQNTYKVRTDPGVTIGGCMIQTPGIFSGYLVLPLERFCQNKVELDWENIAALQVLTEYTYYSDASARYVIGDVFTGKLNQNTLQLSQLKKFWTPDPEKEYAPFLNGKPNPGVTADDLALATYVEGGSVYLIDYDHFNNKTSGITVKMLPEMLQNGFCDLSAIEYLRLHVDNTGNEKDIPYNVKLKGANGNETSWALSGLGLAIFRDETTGKYSYCAKNVDLIPAGFKGEIILPLDGIVFACADPSAEFPAFLQDSVTLTFPTVSAANLPDFTHFKLSLDFITSFSEETFGPLEASPDYTITYELGGGTNAAANPATYKAGTEVTLAEPTYQGFEFAGWYLSSDFSGSAIAKLENFAGDLTLYAKWTARYTITFEVGEHGTIYPRTEEVERGATLTFSVFPDDGYVIRSVKVNGVEVILDENDSFTLENITENQTIAVEFEKEQTADPGPGPGPGEQKPAEEGLPDWVLPVVIPAAVLFVGAIVAAVLILRRKKK